MASQESDLKHTVMASDEVGKESFFPLKQGKTLSKSAFYVTLFLARRVLQMGPHRMADSKKRRRQIRADDSQYCVYYAELLTRFTISI